ncbi:hypothetical protein JTE90_008574 [Oedothorax gibbosus]|uniref:Uncharacterized protein n=1 Tax=Oedothorax gibbosus TaxID=931172 RepID=A0AAV6TDH0_9ARAC|nr:hypothetical protein JTE90_008574 [Oedothorax gibbosus]
MTKYDSKSDISLYLAFSKEQQREKEIPEEQWVSHPTGLLPKEMAQLIAREPGKTYEDFEAVKKGTLNRFKNKPRKSSVNFL